jgi:hypothetical protein
MCELITICYYCDGVRIWADSVNVEHRWNDTDREKPKNSEKKPVPSATLSTTNPTWTDMVGEPGPLR